MVSKDLRFGLIGTGRIGRVHAASITGMSGAVLARVADPFMEGAREVESEYGAIATDSPEDLIKSHDLDAVVIASPTPTHLKYIMACIDHGLPVLSEKPIDLDITKVDAVRERIASSPVPVALGFNQRFDPGFAEVKRRILEGEIGSPEQVTIVSRDPAPPPRQCLVAR